MALPGTASVGTDGTISYNGSLSGSGVGTAGQFTLSGKGGATVADLSCGTTITLCDTSSNTVDITGTELAVTSSRGGYGSGTACAGVGNVVLPSVTVKGAASGR
ncbi:MAG: hypothetical protein VX730_04200, partial [Pseudomonadota bacterium]|nr:hypothetical protein [Pseudomonadota bacterium]